MVSLSQLMLDPYFRTMDGFFVLIEKDWLAFGYTTNNTPATMTPIFYTSSLQTLACHGMPEVLRGSCCYRSSRSRPA